MSLKTTPWRIRRVNNEPPRFHHESLAEEENSVMVESVVGKRHDASWNVNGRGFYFRGRSDGYRQLFLSIRVPRPRRLIGRLSLQQQGPVYCRRLTMMRSWLLKNAPRGRCFLIADGFLDPDGVW